MLFTFETEWPGIVLEVLSIQNLLGISDLDNSTVRMQYPDDTLIRELYQWAAAAFACGLIELPRIERM